MNYCNVYDKFIYSLSLIYLFIYVYVAALLQLNLLFFEQELLQKCSNNTEVCFYLFNQKLVMMIHKCHLQMYSICACARTH